MTIGPATEEGFFYDFLPKHNFKEEDLPLIEERMHELVEENLPITHEEISKDEARKMFNNNPFKLELIDDIPGDTVGIISNKVIFMIFVEVAMLIQPVKLNILNYLHISGSYWRADRNNQPLQRITGTAFFTAARS